MQGRLIRLIAVVFLKGKFIRQLAHCTVSWAFGYHGNRMFHKPESPLCYNILWAPSV